MLTVSYIKRSNFKGLGRHIAVAFVVVAFNRTRRGNRKGCKRHRRNRIARIGKHLPVNGHHIDDAVIVANRFKAAKDIQRVSVIGKPVVISTFQVTVMKHRRDRISLDVTTTVVQRI